jgi:PAS domain S-box-containing protein
MMDEYIHTIFDYAPVGLLYSEDRIIRHCNTHFATMFGYRVDELANQSLSELYPSAAEFVRTGETGIGKLVAEGGYRDERIMKRRDGELFWCRVRGNSLNPDAPFSQAVWSFTDISQTRPITRLTMRERQVAKLMADGQTSKEIARTLEISPRTVEVHRRRLMEKFGVRNSLELVANLAGIPL